NWEPTLLRNLGSLLDIPEQEQLLSGSFSFSDELVGNIPIRVMRYVSPTDIILEEEVVIPQENTVESTENTSETPVLENRETDENVSDTDDTHETLIDDTPLTQVVTTTIARPSSGRYQD